MGDSERLEGITGRPVKAAAVDAAGALVRARAGESLTQADLRAILRISPATFRRHAARGAFDALRVVPRVGPERFAGLKVARYIDGDGMRDTDRVFGRRTRSA